MYNVLASVISAGGFKLADIQHKIKKLYVIGDLTEEQMDELLALASGNISADAERPEVLSMLKHLSGRIDDLEKQMNTPGSEPEKPTEYEAWCPWDGISNKYQKGAIVSHNGKLWISIFEGQNVWEPGATGTDALWRLYEE